MKQLYFDCSMGAAGDMLASALLELLPDPDGFVKRLNALGLPGVEYVRERTEKCGIAGTHLRVLVHGAEEHAHHHDHHDHEHSGLHDIAHRVSHLALTEAQRREVLAVYDLLAEAESKVHGRPVPEIHFHEVGTLDALADVTAVCLLMEALAPDAVTASPVHVGSGQVRCAHGILPIPAPATAELLKGIPSYGGEVRGELCTPTGAALLRHFVTKIGPQPVMAVSAVGYGMGTKDFERANCVRALLGETGAAEETVWELCCNLDDATGEELGYAMERLFEAGALDVWTTPIGMKKARPGVLLSVLCREETREAVLRVLFRDTATLGIRSHAVRRDTLERAVETVETPYGPVRRKVAAGYGVRRAKPEYEDLARAAREHGVPLRQVARATED